MIKNLYDLKKVIFVFGHLREQRLFKMCLYLDLKICRGRKRFVSEGDGGRIKPDGYANKQ